MTSLSMQTLSQALATGNRATIVATVQNLVSSRAALGDGWKSVAVLAQHLGELTLAHQAIAAFADANPAQPERRLTQASMLASDGRMDEAERAIGELPHPAKESPQALHLAGIMALNRGDRSEATDCLREAALRAPNNGQAWLSLSTAADLSPGSADGDLILEQSSNVASDGPRNFAAWCYAAGRVHLTRQEHEQAFGAFAGGARAFLTETPYNSEADRIGAREATRGLDRLAPLPVPTAERPLPIFVMGLPRSGTTLVEQILVSHSQVANGAEVDLFGKVATQVGSNAPDALNGWVAKGGNPGALAQLYRHLAAERFPGAGRFVDKSLNSQRFAGQIAELLPDAPMIWVRRDPLDTAWSCFQTFFTVDWSYDLRAIAQHFRLEEELREDLKSALGKRLMVVDYDALTNAPEAEIPRIIAHCGLSFEEQVLQPQNTKRVVTTFSVTQVREPIHRRAIGSAAPYRRFLTPFLDEYRRLGGAA